MNNEVINDFIKMIKNEPYMGLEFSILQTDALKMTVTAQVIVPHAVIEDITELCKKHNLLYYYRVSLDNKPEIMIFEDEEPF